MFFKGQLIRVKERFGSGYTTEQSKVSWFESKVEKLLRERLDKMAKDWLVNNSDFLCQQFATVMSAKMPELVAQAIFKPVDSAVMNMEYQLKQQISEYMQQQFQGILPMPGG